jgi:hypothetical protein
MLNDLLRGGHRREVFVLVSALQAGIAADLLRTGSGVPMPLLLGRLRQRLEDDLMLRADAAHWAVETWALALGVIDSPVQMESAPPTGERQFPPSGKKAAEVLWTPEAERELKKIPFFVRGKARRNTESFATERGIQTITVETLYDAKAHFAR